MNTDFSEFVRNASEAEKRRVYMRVMDSVTEQQQKILDTSERTLVCYHCLKVSNVNDLKRFKKCKMLKACPACGHTTFYST